MSYNWDLIQYLLHEVQHSANENFKPRLAAEAFALAQEDAGQPLPNMDHLRAEAADYEDLLLNGGFIQPRPEEAGGIGENFVLTERGARLLGMLDKDAGGASMRRLLDEKGEAVLVPEVFDPLAEGR
ncbi:hypothetical protein [Stutzerimonas azotifigens]|uniref:hypothetical protein n=1 Tax=Stutzerimonas azotifigens TaxID=291995 RepID=UPI0003FFE40E|nr:hypothetical protein [Stutzerimonas azotifigens]